MRRVIRKLRSWLLCFLVVCWVFSYTSSCEPLSPGVAQSVAKTAQPARQEQPAAKPTPATAIALRDGFAYFFDLTGDYEKIAVATGKEEAHGQIPAAAKVVQPFQTSGFDGCVFCGARYDRRSGRLYAVMAKQASGSEDAANHFEVVAVGLPRMQTLARIDVSFADPVVLLAPLGNRLLASYQLNAGNSGNQLSFGLSILDAPALKLLRTLRETTTIDAYTSGNGVKTNFSDQAYFGTDGKTIYDHFSRTTLDGDQLSKEIIDPVSVLVKSGDKSLEPFALVDLRTKAPTFDVTYIDSAAGKVLVALNAGRNSPQGLIVINLDSQTHSPVVKVAQTVVPASHLTPDGTQIVIEDSELRHPPGAKPDEPQQALFKTGRLIVFNGATGEKVREVAASEISGFDSRLVCFSPDGRAVFFAHQGHLFDVNLVAGTVSQESTNPAFVFNQWTQCVMADR
jgi:hypothetical protein